MNRLVALLLVCVGCGTPSSPSVRLYQPAAVDPEAVRKVCTMAQSCLERPQFGSVAACVDAMEYGLASGIGVLFGPSVGDLQRYVGCVAGATDCAAALACASAHHDSSWCPAGRSSSCDGNTRVYCVSGWGLILDDCAAIGQRCAKSGDSTICTSGAQCDPRQPSHCDGTTSLERRLDCRYLDAAATCAVVSDGNGGSRASCVKSGSASCSADGERCDGDKIVTCYGGIERVVDCGSYGNGCARNDQGHAACVPKASDCTSRSPDTCDGDAVRACVNGRWATTSCASIGLRACASDERGARCVR